MMPRNRQPKAKEFVRPPFIACPGCKQPDAFGVLSIYDEHYVRRCIKCWLDQRVPLPLLDKKVIYLDQFMISNIMKELDPDRPIERKNAKKGFYRAVFDKLDRLSKLQLIVVPHSPIQDHESLVDPRYQKLKSVFRHLSHGVEFHRPELFFHRQLLRAFRNWLEVSAVQTLGDRDGAFTGNRNAWMDRIRIELDYTLPGLADSLRRISEARTQHLHAVCQRWKQAPSFEFKEVFEGELGAVVEAPWREYIAHAARFYRAQQLKPEDVDIATLYPPEASNLVTHMFSDLRAKGKDSDSAFACIAEFFQSSTARSVPFGRVSAMFWATIAREVYGGRSEVRFPTASMNNDIDMVAAYHPFCDAMFVDIELWNFTAQAELKRELSSGARLFSSRGDGDQEFLSYLDSIEAAATPDHLEGVRIVYGPNWPKTYWELLEQKK